MAILKERLTALNQQRRTGCATIVWSAKTWEGGSDG
jgi:hypothetical protein